MTSLGLGAVTDLTPGGDIQVNLSLDTTTTGEFSNSVTFTGSEINASGYTASVADQDLTITGTILVPAGTPRLFDWTGEQDTNFANAQNWNDISDNLSPALTPPGALDTAEFAGGGGVVTGVGTVAVLEFGGSGTWVLSSGADVTCTDQLILDPGATLVGTLVGGGANTTVSWRMHTKQRDQALRIDVEAATP